MTSGEGRRQASDDSNRCSTVNPPNVFGFDAKDLRREEDLRRRGWTVIRFSDDDVENDAEAVGRAIANKLGIPYEFKKRQTTGSAMRSVKAAK